MSYRTLPLFERGIDATPETAKQDRIEIELGDWLFIGDDSELQSGILHLREETYTSVIGENGLHNTYGLFGSRQGHYNNFTIAIHSGRGVRIGAPLFAGRLKFRHSGGDDFSPSAYQLSFQLELNPTRALNHQPLHPDIRAGRQATSYPPTHLHRRRALMRVGEEIVLDGSDNVILDARQQAMSTPQHWAHYRNLYLTEVDRFLDDVLCRAFRRPELTGSFRRVPRFNLTEVENYWEFRSDDPVRLVYQMEPLFRSLGTQGRFRRYEGVVTDLSTDGHVPALNSKLVEGVSAKVYAKTTRRIRVEAEHDLRSSNRVSTAHTANDISTIITLIDEVAAHDAREVSTLLRTLELTGPAQRTQMPAYELVRRVLLATPDPSLQQPLLSILINARGIRCASGDPLRPAVDALIRAGVVERSRRNSSYFRMTEDFRSACELLASETTEENRDR